MELNHEIYGNNIERINELLDSGVDVNSISYEGLTPLMTALKYGKINIANILLERGADPNIVSDKGLTALMVAAATDFMSNETVNKIIKLLLDHGADPNIVSNDGLTALMMAIQLLSYKDNKYNRIKLLSQSRYNPDINIVSNVGLTALHYAANICSDRVIELLLNRGADVNIQNYFGKTAIDICPNDRRDVFYNHEKGKYKHHYHVQQKKTAEMLSKKSGLDKNIHQLILFRRDQQTFCQKLKDTQHLGSLLGMAEILGINYNMPMPMAKEKLCKLISAHLSAY